MCSALNYLSITLAKEDLGSGGSVNLQRLVLRYVDVGFHTQILFGVMYLN